jgi:hypothetical protein
LWGVPGSFASWKWEGFRSVEPQINTDGHGWGEGQRRRMDGYGVSGFGYREQQRTATAIWQNAGQTTNGNSPCVPLLARGGEAAKRSRYFRMRAEDYASEERYEERARRVEELVAVMRRNFDMEDWAARVGFANAARLKRACLNVVGRSLRAIERAFAEEVVRYYICAEDKVLRLMACRDEEKNPRVIRARWVYAKTEFAPKEPFLDEWSKAEELASEWLKEMRNAFGGVT